MNCTRENSGVRQLYQPAVVALVLALVLSAWRPGSAIAAGSPAGAYATGDLEAEIDSDFSRIRIRTRGSVHSLLFVRDSGEEVVESMVDIESPHRLLAPYTRFMFAGYLFRPKQEQVLIVGLGGGSMVHFLKHHDPEVRVDVVEIDPAVVKIADRYFGVRSGGNVRIVTADGFTYLADTQTRYDVIYMDAFLKPSAGTDGTGVPARLKTLRFYKDVQGKLEADGLVVFNLNRHPAVTEDIKTIRNAFPQVYVFRVSETNLVVIGSLADARAKAADLRSRALAADRRFQTDFSFRKLLGSLVR